MWKNKLFEFTCLPFGLSSGPRVFTKLLRPVVSNLRSRGNVNGIYLDDLLLISNSYESCQLSVYDTRICLERLGFVINYSKSELKPTQIIKFLGFIFNSETMTMSLPLSKSDKLVKLCAQVMRKSTITVQNFSKFIGSLVAACPAVPYGLLYTKVFERYKFLTLRKCSNYKTRLVVNEEILNDVKWWHATIPSAYTTLGIESYDFEIHSDSSMTGWGISCPNGRTRGFWSIPEQQISINYLELKAAYYGLRCYASDFKDCRILLRIDNTTAIAYINHIGGVQFPMYNALACELWQFCEHRKIIVFASYIPTKLNVEADTESRRSDSRTEWTLSDTYFDRIVDCFGKPSIDLFASNHNRKCKRFISWLPDPFAWKVDAFTVPWDEFFYAFPPFSMILRCLQKIRAEHSTGILVVPQWPNQPWFPIFQELLVVSPLYMGPAKDLLFFMNRIHPLSRDLILVAGILSGKRL